MDSPTLTRISEVERHVIGLFARTITARNIQTVIDEARWTQAEAADRFAIPPATLHAMLRGTVGITVDHLAQIEAATGVTPAWLVTDHDEARA